MSLSPDQSAEWVDAIFDFILQNKTGFAWAFLLYMVVAPLAVAIKIFFQSTFLTLVSFTVALLPLFCVSIWTGTAAIGITLRIIFQLVIGLLVALILYIFFKKTSYYQKRSELFQSTDHLAHVGARVAKSKLRASRRFSSPPGMTRSRPRIPRQ